MVNRNNLIAGINFWLKEKPRWDRDFHNGFYEHLRQLRSTGLTAKWWEEIVEFLTKWTALRPKSKQFVYQRGLVSLPDLRLHYASLRNKSNVDLVWREVEPLFVTAQRIKGVTSPVFASKLCHFIAPGAYSIVDNEVLGGTDDYEEYWRFCKTAWLNAEDKDNLINILTQRISGKIIPDYPWSTRIVELCLIGKRANA
jgi:hypothetical protein